ncbi:MAG: hypothetical protein ACI9G1_004891 [Pirellulaceae bacterium]|jgi:hypothetical protein
MRLEIQNPIDQHQQGLVPGADPYIAQLVWQAELEAVRQNNETRGNYSVVEFRVKANRFGDADFELQPVGV